MSSRSWKPFKRRKQSQLNINDDIVPTFLSDRDALKLLKLLIYEIQEHLSVAYPNYLVMLSENSAPVYRQKT
jgi:hypothetical protein